MITLLGTGASYAVPSPGCNCSICKRGFRPFAKWYRTRCSALVESKGKKLLLDVSPDFREQALKHNIPRIDACLISHAHADAIMGLSDVRAFSKENKIPVLGSSRTLKRLRETFSYAFDAKIKTSRPNLQLHVFPKTVQWESVRIKPLRVLHPPVLTHGFRINDLAYFPDIKKMPDETKRALKGIRTLVLGAASDIAYKGHQNIFESIALAQELKAKKTFFTHIGHRIEQLKINLPKGMKLAFDGQKIRI